MSACSTLSFTGITPQVWSCIEAAVKSKYGITIDGYSGQVSDDGFTIVWNVDINAGTGTVQCTDSPWFVPCWLINSTITSDVQQCGGQPG